jgi:uncharacterized protein (TIGR00266 family)
MESKGPELRPPVNFIGQDQAQFSDPSTLLNVAIENRPSFAHAKIFLAEGQEVLADWGSLLWMDGQMRMETWCHGGLWKAWWRVCAGEHCCQNKYTAAPGGSEIAFGDDLPGDILPFAVTPGNGWILSHGAFLCGTTNIRVDARFAGCLTCCFGGEGPFFSRITVDDKAGLFFAGGYGQISRHEVPEGKVFLVHAGMFFAANEKMNIGVGWPGGCWSFCFSQEGWVMKFQGPCVVYTQNRDPDYFRQLLHPYSILSDILQALDKQQNGSGAGGANISIAM